MGDFPLSRITEFILTVVPFKLMGKEEIEQIAATMEIAYYPCGELIMRFGEKIPDYVYIIQTGSVKLTVSDEFGGEILVDVREAGDVFGALSILRVKKTVFNVKANEDIIAYLLPAEVFLQLAKRHPEIEQYFSYSLAGNVKKERQAAVPQLPNLMTTNILNLDMFLIGKSVADIMVTNVLTCPPEKSIRDAAKLMTQRQVSSIVIIKASGSPIGILTDNDLRQKVIAHGYSVDEQVVHIMNSPLLTIHPAAYAFDALLEMSRHGISHLVVVEDDLLRGIISEHEFQLETGNSPVGVIGDIEKSSSLDELVNLRPKIDHVLEMMVLQRIPPRKSTELITEFNDRVTSKINKITELYMKDSGFGAPPVPYCWMALGSEGRREQTLRTDQDNALLFENVPEHEEKKIKDWFLMYSEKVVDGLVRYGFPRCRGGIMASNPKWCQSEEQWENIFFDWVIHPEALALRMASIFFDFRPVYGDKSTLEKLRQKIHSLINNHYQFLQYMAKNALDSRPPLSFFHNFVVEKTGEHRNELNLKLRGVLPLNESARVMALEMNVNNSNTVERLTEVSKKNVISNELLSDLIEAFDFITSLRLVQHLEARQKGEAPNNFVNPAKLTGLQRALLKESFAVINQLQEKLEYRYGTKLLLDG